jgi:putative component of toxin-antitoxin plasmid stabilization module
LLTHLIPNFRSSRRAFLRCAQAESNAASMVHELNKHDFGDAAIADGIVQEVRWNLSPAWRVHAMTVENFHHVAASRIREGRLRRTRGRVSDPRCIAMRATGRLTQIKRPCAPGT